ncbi:MAG: DUF3592 domain-containing protein [Patescibacteria group bacterium]|nr:DUF3592 domain-containing protein [Patescibacteria group bacterium]
MRFQFNMGHHRGRREDGQPATVAAKFGSTVFFLFFLGMGTGFCILLAVLFFRNLDTYRWPETNATIIHSTVQRADGGQHRFEVQFQYTVDNRDYTAGSYDDPTGGSHTSDDRASVERLAARYPVGSPCTAYVHPTDPTRAILARPGLWLGLAVFFPLIFVAIGAGGIYFTWFGDTARMRSIAAQGMSKQAAGRWVLRGMGVVFTMVGLVVTGLVLVLPVVRVQQAKSWNAVAATVVASRVVTHQDDDGATYSVDVLYEYEIDGRKISSNRYHFSTGSSSGRAAKQAIVNDHPPGKPITAYVNPADPFDAVIDRDYPDDLWFGLIPLVFCGAGLAMIVGSFYVRDKRSVNGITWLPAAAIEKQDAAFAAAGGSARGRVVLRQATSPLGRLAALVLGAVIWNGIVSVMVVIAVNSHRAGNPEWFLTFFAIPFVLAGLGLICAVPYQCLAMLNPSLVLEVDTATPALGSTLQIDWRLQGQAGRLSTLKLQLVGEEHATYRRGTNSVTDKHTLFEQIVLETSDMAEIVAGGHLDVLIPADVMHSFESDNNKIVWSFKATGDIKHWPDMKAEFRLVLRPCDLETLAHG